jgi:neopullulanase
LGVAISIATGCLNTVWFGDLTKTSFMHFPTFKPWAVLAALWLCHWASWADRLPIAHVEPPNWWAGMKSPALDIMIHAPGIAGWSPALVAYPGVRLLHAHRSDSPNYLWLQLHIARKARPGTLTVVLRKGQATAQLRYALLERSAGSAQREGFTSADVVLNLMPDRFANGNPDNDNLAGFKDPLNRASSQGRHGGDIAGMVQHLDYIASMGYTAIWPTPLIENNQPVHSYHGYASTDSYRIDARYGTNEDYRRLVQQARRQGLKVIQDIVPNHIGDHHWWMGDLPAHDWLSNHNRYTPTNHARTAVSDPYAADRDREGFTSGWFAPSMPDLNPKNPWAARYLIQNAIWWAEYAGIAGFRVDTYGYSGAAFINEWTRRLRHEYPRIGMVGEEWTDNPAVQAYWASGAALAKGHPAQPRPGMMDFALQGQMLKAWLEPESWNTGLKRLYESLVNDRLYDRPDDMVLFDGNHDMPRIFSVLNADVALTRMALAYVLTAKRTPQMYYGTEVLMTSPATHHDFDAFRADFPGGWAGDVVNAFTGEGLSPEQKAHQLWLKTLLNWRKAHTVMHSGRLKHFAPENGTYVLFRYDERSTVMVAFNKNQTSAVLATDRFREILPPDAQATDVITGARSSVGAELSLPARSVTILHIGPQAAGVGSHR